MNTKLPENSLILLEGGSLRGLYTAGALDILMEHDLYFPAVGWLLPWHRIPFNMLASILVWVAASTCATATTGGTLARWRQ